MSDLKLVIISLAAVAVAGIIFLVTRKHHGPKPPPAQPYEPGSVLDGERRRNGDRTP